MFLEFKRTILWAIAFIFFIVPLLSRISWKYPKELLPKKQDERCSDIICMFGTILVLIDLRELRRFIGSDGNVARTYKKSFGAEPIENILTRESILFGIIDNDRKWSQKLHDLLPDVAIEREMDTDENYFIDDGLRKYTIVRIKDSITSDFYSFKTNGVVRILPRFETIRKRTQFGVVNIPLNVSRFEWYMRRSELTGSGHHFVISDERNEALMRKVVKFREWAAERDATLTLASDTLLAWLTGCDILCNNTSAINLSFFIEEYYNGFIYDLSRVPFMKLKTRLNTLRNECCIGGANSGGCISFHVKNFVRNANYKFTKNSHTKSRKPGNLLKLRATMLQNVDVHIFFLYHNSTASWIGGLIEGWNLAYKLEYPLIDRVCTAIFLGHFMYVPCNVYQYVDAQYGQKWRNLEAHKLHLWNGSPENMRMLEAYSNRIPVSAYFKAYD